MEPWISTICPLISDKISNFLGGILQVICLISNEISFLPALIHSLTRLLPLSSMLSPAVRI